MTDSIGKLMEQRRLKKSNLHEYNLLNKEITKKCSEAKDKWLNQQCSEIENNFNINTKNAHKNINEITGKPSAPARAASDQNAGLFS